MKWLNKLSVLILLLYLWIFAFTSCNSQEFSTNDLTSKKIDSLIEVQKVNKQCLLIKFGCDVITAIKTEKGIVVIDAGISTGLTAKYRKIIENEFQRNDFAYVIISHCHPDHNGGNSVFSESRIIGQINCQEEISKQLSNPEKTIKYLSKIVAEYEIQLQTSKSNTNEWNEIFTQKVRYLYAYNDAKNLILVKKPDITFTDSMSIDMGDITFEMCFFGKCHSNSDILIYIPELSILFIGDLFSKYGRPSINDTLMTDKDSWKKAVKWIEKRMINIDKIIDGHGQALTINDLKSFNNNIKQYYSKK